MTQPVSGFAPVAVPLEEQKASSHARRFVSLDYATLHLCLGSTRVPLGVKAVHDALPVYREAHGALTKLLVEATREATAPLLARIAELEAKVAEGSPRA